MPTNFLSLNTLSCELPAHQDHLPLQSFFIRYYTTTTYYFVQPVVAGSVVLREGDPYPDRAEAETPADFAASAGAFWLRIPSTTFLSVLVATSTPSNCGSIIVIGDDGLGTTCNPPAFASLRSTGEDLFTEATAQRGGPNIGQSERTEDHLGGSAEVSTSIG